MPGVNARIERISDRVCAIVRSHHSPSEHISIYPVSQRDGQLILSADAEGGSFFVKTFNTADETAS